MASISKPRLQPSVSLDGVRRGFEKFCAGIAQGYSAYLIAQSRTQEFERLNAKTDKELESLGIARDDIARYVFRDLIGH